MLNLADSAGMAKTGFSSDKSVAPESRANLKTEQLEAFGPAHLIIDMNEVLSKPVLQLRELFKYFVINFYEI